MSARPEAPVTDLLLRWRGGDSEALERMLPLVYDELRALAARYMRRERPGHTLQATALVHEAYARLVDADIEWQDRVHFFAVAARTMRRVLVDHAKAHNRQKRGGGEVPVTLDDTMAVSPARPLDLLALDQALDRLGEQDRRKADAVELHYFGGLTHDETASVLEVSPATVDRDLRLARAWLCQALEAGEPRDS